MDRNDEDIMNPGNGFQKTNADVEGLANSRRLSSRSADEGRNPDENRNDNEDEDDDLGIVRGTEADVTREDLNMLGAKDADQDLGDDERMQASARVDEVEEEDDLDIPGAELDDDNESLGEEDEENNYYSLGGDRHENLEDDPAGGNQDQ